jgi:hypothetical protein
MRTKSDIDKERIDRFLKSLNRDIKAIKFEETDNKITFRIGNFIISKEKSDDYDYDVKKLFEDFFTNTSTYYIRHFWEL